MSAGYPAELRPLPVAAAPTPQSSIQSRLQQPPCSAPPTSPRLHLGRAHAAPRLPAASRLPQVIPCTKRFVHDWTICPFAHAGEKAVRRDPRLHNYTGIACPDMKKVGAGGLTPGQSVRC